MTDDFFRSRLDLMIDLKYPLAVLVRRMPWAQTGAAMAPVFVHREQDRKAIIEDDLFGTAPAIAGNGVSRAGRPRLSIRLMASLLYLKHAHKQAVERWAENVAWQYFSGRDYYEEPKLPCDATQVGRFRTAIGEA